MEASEEGHHQLPNGSAQHHLPNGSDDGHGADSRQPTGQEVVKELMQVKKELVKVVKELTQVQQELVKVNAELVINRDRAEEQERQNKELMAEVDGLREVRGPATKSTRLDQKPTSAKVLRIETELKLAAAPTVDKNGIVHRGHEVYVFNESVWDSLIFLGLIKGAYEAADMMILGFINLLIQLFFCALLITLDLADTGKDVYTEAVNAFIQWRIGVAHQAEHYDPLTNSSLAQRVCFEYGGTIASRRQQDDLDEASSYYNVKEPMEFQGPGLLMLALALWMALIFKEVFSIWGFSRMLLALALNGTGETKLTKEDDRDELEINSMSKVRACSIFFIVVVPRLFISLMLCYVGIFYLRQTFGVEEIILNAMALGFVLEIDELLFTFLPAAARYVVSNVNPVSLEIQEAHESAKTGNVSNVRKLFGAVFERTRVLLVILVVIIIYFRFTLISKIQDSMEISQLILCDGNKQFVFKESRATKVLHLAQTVDMSGRGQMNLPVQEIQDVFDAVLQATNLCNVLEGKKGLQDRLELCDPDPVTGGMPGMWCDRCQHILSLGQKANLWQDESLEDTIALVTATRDEALSNLECTDRYTTLNETFIPAALNDLLTQSGANFSAALCQEMEEHCVHPDLQIREVVRIFCPGQCQCDHGTSATVNKWFFNRIGCVPTCQTSVESELAQLQEDLVLGKEKCTDRDGELSEEQWRTYAEDAHREFVKRGFLYEEGGLYYASESIAGFFGVKTKKDMKDFVKTVVHISNQPTVHVDGCTLPKVPIDLVTWARTAGSICRWARIVQYVFGVNLCSHTILLADGFYGFNALGGLCPLSCGIGSCSQVQPEGDVDSRLDAWYNVVPWGQDARYNFNCDRDNVMCVEVEKWSKWGLDWPSSWKINITKDAESATVVYSAGHEIPSPLLATYAKDIACMRPTDTNSSCYVIESTERPPEFYYTDGMRWRLTEVGSGQFLAVGSTGEKRRACGLNWLNDLGVECEHGDIVSVMTSWHQMQVDREIIRAGDPNYDPDPDELRMTYMENGMFAFRRGLLEGGNGGSAQILYSHTVMGIGETVPLSRVALPLHRKKNTGQRFAPCLPSSELSALGQDKTLCENGNVQPIHCGELVSQVHCQTPIVFVRELFESLGCQSDLDGLSDDDTVDLLCPSSCKDQAACPVAGEDGYYYSEYFVDYYRFHMAGCLHSDCECLRPFNKDLTSILTSCWLDLNLTRNWKEEDSDSTMPESERDSYLSVVEDGTFCASEDAGFLRPTFFVANMTKWCFVSPSCWGSKPALNAGTCSWRPAYERECSVDRSRPEFCDYANGAHVCDVPAEDDDSEDDFPWWWFT